MAAIAVAATVAAAAVRKRVSALAAVKERVSETSQKQVSVASQKWISSPLQKAVTKQDAKALLLLGVSAAAKTENVVLLEHAIGDLLSTYKDKLMATRLFNKYQEKQKSPLFQELTLEDVDRDNLQFIIRRFAAWLANFDLPCFHDKNFEPRGWCWLQGHSLPTWRQGQRRIMLSASNWCKSTSFLGIWTGKNKMCGEHSCLLTLTQCQRGRR